MEEIVAHNVLVADGMVKAAVVVQMTCAAAVKLQVGNDVAEEYVTFVAKMGSLSVIYMKRKTMEACFEIQMPTMAD